MKWNIYEIHRRTYEKVNLMVEKNINISEMKGREAWLLTHVYRGQKEGEVGRESGKKRKTKYSMWKKKIDKSLRMFRDIVEQIKRSS